MTTTLTGVNAGFDNTAPAPADGDVATGTLFQNLTQRIINNTKWLYDKLMTVGVEAVRNVADTAALKALTGMSNGACAIVRNQGVYVYVDPLATAELLPWVVQPTVGTGRWTLADQNPNRVVTKLMVELPSDLITPSTTDTLADSSIEIVVPDVRAGDLLDVEAHFNLRVDSATSASSAYLAGAARVIGTPGKSGIFHTYYSGAVSGGENRGTNITASTRYVVQAADQAAGSVKARGAGARGTGVASYLISMNYLAATLIRP